MKFGADVTHFTKILEVFKCDQNCKGLPCKAHIGNTPLLVVHQLEFLNNTLWELTNVFQVTIYILVYL